MRRVLMTAPEIRHDYFQWLCDMVHCEMESLSYWILMKELNEREFIFTIDRDRNRAQDGIELRQEYEDYNSLEDGTMFLTYNQPCSVLEMLIALAKRMCHETESTDINENDEALITKYFWEMLENLGLSQFDDESYVDLNGMGEVDRILTEWMDRTFDYDGEGSIFPLKYPPGDQTSIEIWYQMQSYLDENYPY